MACVLSISISVPVSASETNDKLRYGEREYRTVESFTYVYATVTPDGQPEAGTKFPTGGGLYVNTAKGGDTTISVTLSYGVLSIEMSKGLAGLSSEVGGVFLTAPNKTDYFIAKIDKTYKIERVRVDMYKYNELIYTFYENKVTLYQQSVYLEAV